MKTIRKLANAFYSDVEPADLVSGIASFSSTRYKKKHGGLWVGGEVLINSDGISFSPNALNERLHKNIQAIEIPATSIVSIQRKFGWFTGIVEVNHNQGLFMFRCYGAKKLVEHYHGNSNQP